MILKTFINLVVFGSWLASGHRGGEVLALEVMKKYSEAKGQPFMGSSSSSLSLVQATGLYRKGNRRDPFVPLRGDGMKYTKEALHPNTAQTDYEIPTVLGIVVDREGSGAVLQRRDGGRILVRLGSELIPEHARVVGISHDTISLEYRFEENGKVQVFQRRISLPHSDTMGGTPQGRK